MLDYIVLGQIPGTSLQLGFVGYLTLSALGLMLYDIKKFHPKQFQKLLKKLRIDKLSFRIKKGLKKQLRNFKKHEQRLSKKLAKKLRPYKKSLIKKLVHIRRDILGPKLKFLK